MPVETFEFEPVIEPEELPTASEVEASGRLGRATEDVAAAPTDEARAQAEAQRRVAITNTLKELAPEGSTDKEVGEAADTIDEIANESANIPSDIVRKANALSPKDPKVKVLNQLHEKVVAMKNAANKFFKGTRFEKLSEKCDAAGEELAESVTNDPDSFEDNKRKLDEIANQAKDEMTPEEKDVLESKLKKPQRNMLEAFWKYKALLKIGAGLGLFIMFLKLMSDELSGCYKYDGTNSQKLPEPEPTGCNYSKQQFCKCNEETDVGDVDAFCAKHPAYKQFPFCCGTSHYPMCTGGTRGADGVIFYTYIHYSPASIVAQFPEMIDNAIKGLHKMAKSLLMTMLEVGAAIMVGTVVVMVVVAILSRVMRHHTKNDTAAAASASLPKVTSTSKVAVKKNS